MTPGVAHARAEDYLRSLPDASVGLVLTDPPYFRVKGLAWDRAWSSSDGFVEWLAGIANEWRRVLKPNGTLVCFAANNPATARGATLAARIEVMLAERFNIINAVTWVKGEGFHRTASPKACRAYFPQTERVIIAEQCNADGWAMGEAQYDAKCDKARGFVFEPLRAYLDGERQRAGVTPQQVNEATGTQMAGHWFSSVQWALPTAKHYATMRALFNGTSPGEYLRREYEDLRREYEDLRRPFDANAGAHYTDVWTYRTVQASKGKHPCAKPRAMALDIVRQCSRPGDVVLDTFAGSGVFLSAAAQLGRVAIGCDADEWWSAHANRAVANATEPAVAGGQMSLAWAR